MSVNKHKFIPDGFHRALKLQKEKIMLKRKILAVERENHVLKDEIGGLEKSTSSNLAGHAPRPQHPGKVLKYPNNAGLLGIPFHNCKIQLKSRPSVIPQLPDATPRPQNATLANQGGLRGA